VRARLEASLWEVSVARVARVGTIAERARELSRFVRALGADRVNLVAHSMGGLDARFAIAYLGLDRCVASLTTVGTPHGGTPLADLGTDLADRFGLRAALKAMGLNVEVLRDLTEGRMAIFNRETPPGDGVAYGCVVGVARRQTHTNPLLWPTRLYLSSCAGDNDGLVPAASQRFGDVLAEIDADHWAQIGWSPHFDAVEFYATLMRELRGRGL
jgi:triacylglycerol lipase